MKKRFLAVVLFLCIPVSYFPYSTRGRPAGNAEHSFSGTYPGRIHDELRKARQLRQVIEARRSQLAALIAPSGATQDADNIAVIKDDGNLVAAANQFDLAGKNLKLNPNGTGSYSLTVQSGDINQDFGTKLPLTDDDSSEIAFQAGFRFPFFGTNYSSVFINSDGNITFTEGDSEHTARDLIRFNSGAPRIAALLADLDPTSGQGGIYYKQLADRFIITWKLVREFDGFLPSTAQLSLFSNGSFELTYGAVATTGSIVGWSQGSNLKPVTLVDLSVAATSQLSGPVAERFSQQSEVDLTAVAQKFYETHEDNYDQLIMFTNFPYDLGLNAFSFEINVKNDIQGIGVGQLNFSQEFGSAGNLESFLAMNELGQFPDDPDTVFLGTNSTINVLGQEVGHRWLAYVNFREGTTNSTALLGRDNAHWSFFFNSEGSVMEGNLIEDHGDGSFTTTGATDRYSKLDQYIMGFRAASDVGSLFYVADVSGTTRTPSSSPELGATFKGTRKNPTVNDIIAAEGPRIPDAAAAPKVFREAFILLVPRGTTPSAADMDKIGRIRSRWQEFFFQATDQLGAVETSLSSTPLLPSISTVVPASGSTLGNTRVYISGSNFQSGATVAIGTADASDVRVVSTSLITATTAPGSAGAVNVVVTNPGAQPAIRSNAFTYRSLNPAVVAAGALKIPYIADNFYFRSNLGINNPNSTLAHVRVMQLDGNGLEVNELASVSVPPNGFVQENSLLRTLEGSSGITGREGSLALESDQPVQGFVSQINNVSGDPSILDGVRQGAERLILQSAANTGPFRSTLLILNLSAIQALVNIAALNRDTGQTAGTPLQGLTVPPNGFISFDNILAALSLPDSYGPVEIRSTNGAKLAAVSRVSRVNGNTSGFFVAQADNLGSQSEIIPFAVDTDSFRTNLGLNNLGTSTANVSVFFISPDGTTRASTASPIQVAPGGSVQVNNILRYLLTGSSSSGVTNQQGYLKITSDQPIKAFATQIDNLSLDPSIENSVSTSSSALFLKSSANTNFQSTLVIVNPNNSAVTVTLVSRQGGDTGNGTVSGTRTISIAPQGFYSSNNVLQDIGATSSFGPIEMRASGNLPIIAVSRVYSVTGNTSGFFSAQPLP